MGESDTTPLKERRISKRPFGIGLMAVVILLVDLAGFIRLQQAVLRWSFLQTLANWPLGPYLAIGGALWGLVGLPAVYALWRGKPWAARAAWFATIFFVLSYWLDWIFLVESRASQGNAPFAACVSIVWLAAVFFILRSAPARAWLRTSKTLRGHKAA